ncbi:NAD(P)H-hydrate epimerase [bacterium RCC_150]
MVSAFSGTQIRAAEQPLLEAGEGAVHMQRAAYGLANAVVHELRSTGRRLYGSSITVLAGKGNNGGDGLFSAAILARRGMRTTAVLTTASAHTAALAAFEAAGGRVLFLEPDNAEELAVLAAASDVVIDAILGTGARGGLSGPAAELVAALGELDPRLVVACDIPSGVDSDTGEVHWPVLPAELTVTFGGIKAGLLADPGEGCAGRITLVPIGIEDRLPSPALRRFSAQDLAILLPDPGRRAQKYSRGVLGIVAGSERYPGAAALCVEGASRSGPGMVRYLGPSIVAQQVLARTPEAIWEPDAPGRVQAWLLGPGLDGEEQLTRARKVLATARDGGQPAVVDAGGLELLPETCPGNWILTPHAGELATLLSRGEVSISRDDVESRTMHFALQAAEQTGAVVLLKGATTVVASPSGAVFSQADGSPWMGTAGSGDVLSGILGALAAAFAESALDDDGPFAALGIAREDRWAAVAAVGASLHGMAGTAASAGGPISASDIAREVPGIVRAIRRGASG